MRVGCLFVLCVEYFSFTFHNTDQLSRLHKILKPFMLRRVKKDVEHEMAEKVQLFGVKVRIGGLK